MKYLITGVAGFIGYHTAKRILESNNEIIGIDNINDFYDVNLKNARLKDMPLAEGDTTYELKGGFNSQVFVMTGNVAKTPSFGAVCWVVDPRSLCPCPPRLRHDLAG